MINLLPPENKEEFLQERNWKIIMILGINLLLILICFSLILHAINIFILGELNSQVIIYQQKEKEFEASKIYEIERGLKIFNESLLKLDYFYQDRFNGEKFLEEISEVIPSEVYLTYLSLNFKDGQKKEIDCVLSGFSPSREILLSFKENLEKRENFEEVYFPPASWVKQTDINFVVNFKIRWK